VIPINDEPGQHQAREDQQRIRDLQEALAQATRQLNECEEKLRVVNQAALAGIATLRNLRVISCNQAFVGLSGYPMNELEGMDILDLVPEELRDSIRNRHFQRLNGAISDPRYDVPFTTKTGERKWVQVSADLIQLEDGPAVVAAFFDITDRKIAEEKVEATAQWFNHIYENAPVMMHILNGRGEISSVNRKWLEETGYEESEVLGNRISIIMTEESARFYQETFQSNWGNGQVRELPYQYRCKDGSEIDVLVDGLRLISPQGEEIGLSVVRNVTNLNRAIEELSNREEVFRSITTTARDAIIMFDDRYRITYWNPAAERIFGCSSEDVVNCGLYSEFIPERFQAAYLQSIKAWSESSGGPESLLHHEMIARHRDEREFPIELSVSSVLIDGRTQVIALIRDLSERQQAEARIRTLSLAVEQSPAIVVITDLEARTVFINQRFTEIAGYRAEEVLGRKPGILKSGESTPAFYARLWDTIRSGREWRGEFHNRRKDGTLYWESATITPLRDNDGAITGYLKIAEDVTAFKITYRALEESEEKFRNLFAAMAQGIMVINRDGRVDSVNPAAEEILGLPMRDIADMSPESPLWRPIHEDGSVFAITEIPSLVALRTGQSVKNVTMGIFHAGLGEYRWLNTSAAPRFAPGDERPDQVIMTFSDITTLKQYEKSLQEAKETAETANIAKSTFIANMSHEIRTPMNSIIGFTDIMIEEETDPDKVEKLHYVSQSANYLLNIINEILDLSRIEAGKFSVEKSDFRLDTMFEELSILVIGKAEEKELDFVMQVNVQPGTVVTGDPVRLKQVLVNLLANAVKFTMRGSVRLTFRHEGDLGVFEVLDTGIGIPTIHLERIFLPFEQLVASNQRGSEGAGLGLSIAKRTVELMGGKIIAESTVGVGSRFQVITPLPVVVQRAVASTGSDRPMVVGLLTPDMGPFGILERLLVDTGFQPVRLSPGVPPEPGIDLDAMVLGGDREQSLRTLFACKTHYRTRRIPVVIVRDPSEARSVSDHQYQVEVISLAQELTEALRRLHNRPARTILATCEALGDDLGILDRLRVEGFSTYIADGFDALTEPLRKGMLPEVIVVPADFERIAELRDLRPGATILRIGPIRGDCDEDDSLLLCLPAVGDQGETLAQFLREHFSSRDRRATALLREWRTRLEELSPSLDMQLYEALQALPDSLAQLDGAVTDRNLARIRTIAHSLKGYAGMTGMLEVSEPAGEIQIMSMSSKPDFWGITDRLGAIHAVVQILPAVPVKPTESGKRALGKDIRVLVAEDNPINREVIRNFLHWVELESDFAVDGRETLEYLGWNQYDLLLLDMQMPVMSGLEALRTIRADQRFSGLYIVALTAYALKEDRERFLRAGCDDYLSKPIDKERFREIIDFVRKRKHEAEA
jgi:PAS domain S-box-containing protein